MPLNDSFNIIYPTPPTPLPQFSPQNMNAQLLSETQHMQQLCNSIYNSSHENMVELNTNACVVSVSFLTSF